MLDHVAELQDFVDQSYARLRTTQEVIRAIVCLTEDDTNDEAVRLLLKLQMAERMAVDAVEGVRKRARDEVLM